MTEPMLGTLIHLPSSALFGRIDSRNVLGIARGIGSPPPLSQLPTREWAVEEEAHEQGEAGLHEPKRDQ